MQEVMIGGKYEESYDITRIVEISYIINSRILFFYKRVYKKSVGSNSS